MGKNDGHQNEYEIIEVLNKKKIDKLPNHFKKWIQKLFQVDKGTLYVNKLNNEQKADIVLKVGEVNKYISIKSGNSNSFHSEQINTFIPFLREIGISESTLKTIVFFHYGDNTLDGSGPIRFTSNDLRKTHSKWFKLASDELSQDNIMKHVIERFITKGRYKANFTINGIYHGTKDDGFFLPTKLIYQILLRKKHVWKNGTINFKMLSYQPGSRNLWGIPGSEQKRNNSEIKWRSFKKDALNEIKFSK
ncbi:MAG: hypothetical protein WCZ47_03585 [Bacilli bacterium]|jgi:hypothetical protein|nr:hypothetical protein [Bacilli bacterium]